MLKDACASSATLMDQINMKSIALITGASGGLGKALALKLASQDYLVYATARNAEKLAKLNAEANSDNIRTVQLDVTDDISVSRAVEQILGETNGRIDVLVNNAGLSVFGSVETVSLDMCQQQFDINLFGVIRMIKAVGPSMRKHRSGHIVNISSVGGVWGQPLNDIYCASKFALEGLCESMAPVYQQFGVHISLLEPGAIQSDFIKNAKMPDFSKMDPDFMPIFGKVSAFYKAKMESGVSDAQTADEVADVCIEKIIKSSAPPVRVQSNPKIQSIFKMKLNDIDGAASRKLATERFLS